MSRPLPVRGRPISCLGDRDCHTNQMTCELGRPRCQYWRQSKIWAEVRDGAPIRSFYGKLDCVCHRAEAPIPPLADTAEQYERLRVFLDRLTARFYSSTKPTGLAALARRVLSQIVDSIGNAKAIAAAIEQLRDYFRGRPWTALIVPSGDDPDFDNYLCSSEFLGDLVRPWPDFPGLILQLEEPPGRRLVLEHVFPAFYAALSESSAWPGMLIWNRRSQSTFSLFGIGSPSDARERALWLVPATVCNSLSRQPRWNIRQLYKVAFPDTRQTHHKTSHSASQRYSPRFRRGKPVDSRTNSASRISCMSWKAGSSCPL